MTVFLGFVGLLAALGFSIYRLKSVIEQEREAKRQTERWYPQYVQDIERADGMMDPETLEAYAAKHYRRVIAEYRKRDRNADPYWMRSARDLPAEYVSWLVRQPHGHVVLAWYAEPEKLFNAAQRVRSTKDPTDEQSEWRLDAEVAELSVSELRHLLETYEKGGDGYDAKAILEKALAGQRILRRAASE